MTARNPKPRWYHLTPTRFFLGLLVVQGFLLLSQRFQWFAFNDRKGWTVLIAVGVVVAAMVVVLIWGLVCLCLRRRFQFSFGSLLVFLVALSVPLGWFAWEMQRARRQREAVEAIGGTGRYVCYDFLWDETGTFIRDAQPTAPVWLRKSLGRDFFGDVTWVELEATKVTDVGLEHLKGLTCLESLSLCGTRGITGNGLEHLKGLTKLKSLGLSWTQVTDTELEHLKGLTKLEELYLTDTQVTDAGLAHLKGLTSLRTLRLERTQVTDEGVKQLQQAIPNCRIIR